MANYTSDFSGQHNDDYDSRITSLLNTVNEQQNTIITLNNNITTLNNSITNLQTQINNLQVVSGTNYRKYPDGLLIQWGKKTKLSLPTLSAAASSGLWFNYYTIPLALTFYNNEGIILGTSKYSTGHVHPFAGHWGDTTVMIWDVVQRDTSAVWAISWVGIGRWK